MDQGTLKALYGSIRKWMDVAYDDGEEWGRLNCPLCAEFNYGFYGHKQCRGCPVYERTGKVGCKDTPYDEYRYDKSAAEREVDFLISLLPVEHLEMWRT